MMPFLVPFACALVLPAGVAAWGARRRWRLGVGLARVWFAGYLALLLAMTLTASPFHAETSARVEMTAAPASAPAQVSASTAHLNLVPLRSIRRYLVAPWPTMRVELLGNVAAFVPFGLLVPLGWGRKLRWWHVLLAGVALSVGIEVAQFAFVPARVADVDDVLLNGFGVAAGLALFRAVSRIGANAAVAPPSDVPGSPGSHRSAAASRSNACL